jgi:hypothetical protein
MLIDLVSHSQRLTVLITDLETKPFGSLSETDARRDGFSTLAEL